MTRLDLRPDPYLIATGGGGGSAPAALIASINGAGYGDGWTAEWASGTPPTFDPVGSPQTVTVSRAGYTATPSSTLNTVTTATPSDTVTFTERVRQPYPNMASPTATTVAMSKYVYKDDSISGVTNNGTLSSPVPICKWILCDQVMVGSTIHVELQAFHRNAQAGKPVAAVVFVATCASLGVTLTQTVTGMTVSTSRANDQTKVLAYQADFDVSSYADDTVWTVNAQAYPHWGVAASVADSTAGTPGTRGFVPQLFWKNATRLAAPPLAYVTATGNDGTGVVSTTAATAKANGFQTVKGAIEALRTFTSNVVDGCRLRISNVTTSLAASTTAGTYSAGKAAFVIEGDPAEAKATNIFQIGGAANVSMRTGYTRFEGNLSIVRTSTFTIININGLVLGGPAGAPDYNQNGFNAILTNSSSTGIYTEGLNCTGITSSTFNANANADHRLTRGVVSGSGTFEAQCVTGCAFTAATLNFLDATRTSGTIVSFNKCMGITGIFLAFGFSGTVNGFANVQNVFEFTSITTNPTLRPSGDGASTNVTHYVELNTTYAGANDAGRENFLYDETVGTLRTHILCARKGACPVATNYKNDFFDGGPPNNDPSANLHVGTWSIGYGVDWDGHFTQYCSADGGALDTSFSLNFPGLNASIGTAKFTVGGLPPNDPKFTLPRCTTTTNGTTYTVGAGNGDYTVTALSPLKGRMATAALPFDLAGTARSTTGDTTGAYA